ncbi:hypothetical protein DS909_18065 [Phaeobacter gallaeciensis]|uniref:Uncharacterized protein n=1 Tax=Phaeobacter gallaeciensis TaxID=60890 RepID=A0A366WNM6_9RHOB|nr:hypothetical protein DS909_18065 [Phaeobacter gallaeciensis]
MLCPPVLAPARRVFLLPIHRYLTVHSVKRHAKNAKTPQNMEVFYPDLRDFAGLRRSSGSSGGRHNTRQNPDGNTG